MPDVIFQEPVILVIWHPGYGREIPVYCWTREQMEMVADSARVVSSSGSAGGDGSRIDESPIADHDPSPSAGAEGRPCRPFSSLPEGQACAGRRPV